MKKTVAKPKAKTLGKKTAAGKKPQSVLAKLSAKARAAAKGKKPAAKAGAKPTKGTAKAKAVALLNAKKVQTKVSKQITSRKMEMFTIFYSLNLNSTDCQGCFRNPYTQDPHQRALPSSNNVEVAPQP